MRTVRLAAALAAGAAAMLSAPSALAATPSPSVSAPSPVTPQPSAPATPKPVTPFVFGFNDIVLYPPVADAKGVTMRIKVTCPTSVTATSVVFVSDPVFTKEGEDTWIGTATFDVRHMPKYSTLRVSCADYGSVLFEDELPPSKPGTPAKPVLTPTKPKVPVGAPQTGDGSTIGRSTPVPLAVGGSTVLLVALAGGALTVRRRKAG